MHFSILSNKINVSENRELKSSKFIKIINESKLFFGLCNHFAFPHF